MHASSSRAAPALSARPRGGLHVREVHTARGLTRFIRLPWRLYEGVDKWVPPLISERRRHLSREHNPFFEHAQASYLLAWRGGRPVGRISAHVDLRFDERHGPGTGFFGFFECEDDAEVAGALLDGAEAWLRERGRERMLGPLDFTTNHQCGLLIEGHELMPQVLENWHHPYYRGLLESHGMSKAVDLLKWQILSSQRERVLPVIYELADSLESSHGIRVRNMRKRDFAAEVHRFMEVYNSAWEDAWGFVPLTERELGCYARELRPIIDERFTFVAERGEEVVGAALALPDVNRILSRLGGRLLPLGWIRVLRERRRLDEIRVLALGVKRAYRHTGTAAAFYAANWRECLRGNISRAETGWMMESNEPMNRAMRALGGDVVKRFRIYERHFTPALPARRELAADAAP